MQANKSKRDENFLDHAVSAIIGIDPGEQYNGVVVLDPDNGFVRYSATISPRAVTDYVNTNVDYDQVVVMEEFRLAPAKAQYKTGSKLETIEVIGAIKWICRHDAIPLFMVHPSAPVKFFSTPNKEIPKLPPHELSAWRVAEWWRLFKYPNR